MSCRASGSITSSVRPHGTTTPSTGAGLGHTSVITIIESQIEHIITALRYAERTGAASLELRPAALAAFVAEVDAMMKGTVWTSGGCSSGCLDARGRNSTLWPGFTFTFKRRVERFDPADYALMDRRARRHGMTETRDLRASDSMQAAR